ncbi:MAG: DUF2827 domain-containing protein [Paraburkholderia sp.]|uniref:DUF2827 domain-containing protein n=1 Tax=Paraburkholderia sp. TaxID=1926495 RepID=UPI0011FF42ED|nr:DUF2827 domain-containing protein [Paraburkholderia sp.]TAM01518.1 MAG: DUF2827 domain-containing protein [Paraburkholderia sp.]TAM28644.1 MAG: DUF2827 domain-containing protein [Paraburkholderia sp.]
MNDNAKTARPVGRELKVGVSLFVRKGEQSLWENGIFQNCLFLVMLLQRLPQVSEVYLVAGGGDGDLDDARRFVEESPAPMIDMSDAANRLDLMIEMSAQLDREWIARFRERGGRVVSMRVGNDYVIDIERMIFDKPHALLISGAAYDEIWTLPEYEHSCRPYFRSAMRAPVRIVPHLWSPLVLDRAAAKLDADTPFGYRPGRRRWRVGIFEPNICMVKTGPLPMLCCEVAHRANADILEHVWVYNAMKLKEHGGFGVFARSLDIVRHGLASFEGRFPFYQVMASYVDAVVTHQWENAQNYVYYEALHGGYPLIHNSHLIADCGYRYRDFDCEEGGRALLDAFSQHDRNLDAYRRKSQAFLATLYPDHEANLQAYGQAIGALFDNGNRA